jgi:hypothetical protein
LKASLWPEEVSLLSLEPLSVVSLLASLPVSVSVSGRQFACFAQGDKFICPKNPLFYAPMAQSNEDLLFLGTRLPQNSLFLFNAPSGKLQLLFRGTKLP